MANGQGEQEWEAYRDKAFEDAWRYGAGFIKSAGVDPRTPRLQLTYEDFRRLSYALRRMRMGEYSQEARTRYPFTAESFLNQWGVPQSERAGWRDYPVEPAGKGAFYYPAEKRIELGGHGEDVLAHELSHANYFEQMPLSSRAIVYPFAHWLAQRISPEYKEAVEGYGVHYPVRKEGTLTTASKGTLPIEGYATAYQHLGKEQEKMPWYMEPFYGNLMYPVPDLPGNLEKSNLVWLAYWLKNKMGF